MKILCTGYNGYIGKSFVTLARAAGHSVVPATRPDWMYYPSTIFYEDIDVIVHLAAAGVKRHERSWIECMDVNFHALRKFLLAIQASGFAPKIFLAGTEHEENMQTRMDLWNDPYVVSKRLGSMFAHDWHGTYRGKLLYGFVFRCTGEGQNVQIADQILKEIEA